MLKKTITYENFNGVEVTEDLYFNLTTPELTRMNIKYGGDIGEHSTRLSQSGDTGKMIAFIEDMILGSYGEKSDDGKRFVKNQQARENFEYSQAYAEIFEQLLTQPGQAQAFGEGLVTGAKNAQSDKAAMYAKQQARKNVQPIYEED